MRLIVQAAAVVLASACAAQAVPTYSATVLSRLGSTSTPVPLDLNESGQAVGYVALPNISRPATWNADGSGLVLEGPAGSTGFGLAYGINNAGQIVGTAGYNDPQNGGGLLWNPGQAPVTLGRYQGQATLGVDISDAGVIVGAVMEGDVTRPGVRTSDGWTASGPADGYWKTLNENGRLVGNLGSPVAIAFGGQGAFSGQIGSQVVTRLASSTQQTESGVALGVNASGVIAGAAPTTIGFETTTVATIWDANNTPTTLLSSQLVPSATTRAVDINDSGVIVGDGQSGLGSSFGFVIIDGQTYNLRDLMAASSGVTQVNFVYGINNAGQILAGVRINGRNETALLTPVPEPATLGLIGSAVMLLRRRR